MFMITPQHPELNRKVTLLKALAHPSRLWIVLTLMEEERSVRELQQGLNQDMSTVSRHLLVLRNAGLVCFDRRGQFSVYRMKVERLEDLLHALDVLKASPRTGVPME
jgi:ArsR family transcriptional regulator